MCSRIQLSKQLGVSQVARNAQSCAVAPRILDEVQIDLYSPGSVFACLSRDVEMIPACVKEGLEQPPSRPNTCRLRSSSPPPLPQQ